MSKSIKYRFINHISDALIESYGKTLEEAFENATLALIDTMVNIKRIDTQIELQLYVKGEDLYNLLYNWLESVF